MIVYQVTEEGPEFVCRNQRCGAFDQRLRKRSDAAEEEPEQIAE